MRSSSHLLSQRTLTIGFGVVFFVLGTMLFSLALRDYEVKTETRADSQVSLSFGETGDNEDYFMIEMGATLPDIENTAEIDQIFDVFGAAPGFVQLVNPPPAAVDHANFARLFGGQLFPFFSAGSYESLRALATAFYAKYPQKKAIFELTDHAARSAAETTSFAAQFPNAKMYASNFTNWNRERARDLVGTSLQSNSQSCTAGENPNRLPYPAFDGVSYHIDLTPKGTDPAEDIAIFWDEMFDASRDIAGASVKVCWPADRNMLYNLAVSEIKFVPGKGQSETSLFGVLLDTFYNYASVRGRDSYASAGKPVRYVGVGTVSRYSPNAKQVLKVFAHISKDQMRIVHPSSGSGYNMRDQKPFYRIVGHKAGVGYRAIMVNASGSPYTVTLPAAVPFAGYTVASNKRDASNRITTGNTLQIDAYEAVGIYSGALPTSAPAPTSSADPTPTPTASTGNATPTPTAHTPQPTATPTPTTTNPQPTASPTPTRANQGGQTPVPSSQTPAPTATPSPSPTPTLTPTPTPTLTFTPTPTPTLTNTPTPAPPIVVEITATPARTLAVNDQAPGANPLLFLIIPTILLVAGLFL